VARVDKGGRVARAVTGGSPRVAALGGSAAGPYPATLAESFGPRRRFAHGMTSSFTRACLDDLAGDARFDVYVLDFFALECDAGHDAAAFEDLVRRVLALPNHPAVVILLVEPARHTACPRASFDVKCRRRADAYRDLRPRNPGPVYTAMLKVADAYDLAVLDVRAAFAPALGCAKPGEVRALRRALPSLLADRHGDPNDLGQAWIALALHVFFQDEAARPEPPPPGGGEPPPPGGGHLLPIFPKSSSSSEHRALGSTSCFFARRAAAKLVRSQVRRPPEKEEDKVPLAKIERRDDTTLILPTNILGAAASAHVRFGDSLSLDLTGSWYFNDRLPDANVVLRLLPTATLRVNVRRRRPATLAFSLSVRSDTNDTLCCTTTRHPATRCASNHADTAGTRYATATLARFSTASRFFRWHDSTLCRLLDPSRDTSTFDIHAILLFEEDGAS